MLIRWLKRFRGQTDTPAAPALSARPVLDPEVLTTPAGDLRLVVDDLHRRVTHLEREREELLLVWAQTREKWSRFLKRQGGIRSREPLEEPGPQLDLVDDDEQDDEIDRLILKRKLGG